MGLSEVPAIFVEADDAECLQLCLLENMHRKDLSDFEVASLLKRFKDLGYSSGKIAKLVSKTQTWVAHHLRMLELEKLSNVSRDTLKKLTERHARAILAQPEEVRATLMEEIGKAVAERGEPPSVREIERKARELLKKPRHPEKEEGFEGLDEAIEEAEKIVGEAEKIEEPSEMVELKTLEDVERFFDEVLMAQAAGGGNI